MLCITYHRNRNITDEDGSLYLAFFIHALECGSDGIGNAPLVHERIGFHTIYFLNCLGIGSQLSLGFTITFRIYYYDKSFS